VAKAPLVALHYFYAEFGFGVVVCAGAVMLAAPAFDPSVFGSLTWRSVWAAARRKIDCFGGSSARPLEYYFGAVGGGLWKTTDGVSLWRPVTDGAAPQLERGARWR